MVKLTKAQKLQIKQEKLLQKQRAAEEAKLQRKKAEIKREVALQDLALSKINRKWKQFMLDLKIPIYREELKATQTIFDRVIEKKDDFINEMKLQMKFADNQRRLSLAAFADITHRQIDRFHTCIEDMEASFESDLKKLRDSGKNEAEVVADMKNKAEWRMAVLGWAMASLSRDSYDKFYGESVVKFYEMDKTLNIEREEIENALEKQYTSISNSYKKILKEYIKSTATNRKKLEKLVPKDDMMFCLIVKQSRRIDENYILIKKLRQDVQTYDDGTFMAGIRANYVRNRDEYNRARKKVEDDLQTDSTQFSDLVDISTETIKWMERVAKKGERILTAAHICRRLQTMSEISGKGREDISRSFLFDNNGTDILKEALEPFDELSSFWALVAEADISRKALQYERLTLEKENKEMTDILKAWFDDQKTFRIKDTPVKTNCTPNVVEAAHDFGKIARR